MQQGASMQWWYPMGSEIKPRGLGVKDESTDSVDPDCFELLEPPGNGVLDSMGWEIWKELAGHHRDMSVVQ